jgi:hypothetical protein
MNGYKVRGTVRSTEKGDYLKKLFDGVGDFEYVIVEDIAQVRNECVMRFVERESNKSCCCRKELSMKLSRESMELVRFALPVYRSPECQTNHIHRGFFLTDSPYRLPILPRRPYNGRAYPPCSSRDGRNHAVRA